MQYRRLGSSGLQVSVLSYGSWVTFSNQIDDQVAIETIGYAYENGINFFDNAEVYAQGESEKIMGRALKKLNLSRDSYCVSSKVFWGGDKPTQRGLSRKHIHDGCHAALQRLQVDYLDLFFCHRPDSMTPIEETVRAMDSLVQQGKILYWGTSEWSADQISTAYGIAKELGLTPPTMEQPEYNMFHRQRVEKEYSHLYSQFGLGTTIWSPLASGILTGKYADGNPKESRSNLKGFEWLKKRIESEEGQDRIQKTKLLKPIADDLGVSIAHLAICWCLKNPHVSTVILGASNLAQLQHNIQALDHLEKLTPKVLAECDGILNNVPQPEPVY